MDFQDPTTVLDLSKIRRSLIRMEDTIVFALIERAQFRRQPSIYTPGAVPIPGFDGSFMDWILREEEIVHAKVRRYESPDEIPFFPDALPQPILPPLEYPVILRPHPNKININDKIKEFYIDKILPSICKDGEQKDSMGSSALCDVECLRSISRRIHFGRFVAESKFLSETAKMTALIQARDTDGIEAAITNAAVEAAVLERLRKKAEAYGVDPDLAQVEEAKKLEAEAAVAMYRDWVIPLTKVVEVEYLLHRLDAE
ncbi:chorismate mutase [Dipodascopsis tothii]|uniref:chorismate mutase n=1 Tax=Dipodascopsis tothii TaxID=44089 RepID=UPI0034CE20C2